MVITSIENNTSICIVHFEIQVPVHKRAKILSEDVFGTTKHDFTLH